MESSAASFSDIPLYALSRLKLTQEKSYSKDSGTESYQSSLSGTTLEPLTESLGEDSLTLSVEGSPAKILAQPEKARESEPNDLDYGLKWQESFAKYDRNSSLWKTPQCSLLGGLEEFSETWPKWGMMQDGECLALTIRVPHTNGTGYGYWPTPDTCAGGTGPSQAKRNQPRLQDAVKMWATPTKRDWKEQTLSPSLAVMHLDKERSKQLPRQMSLESPELHGGKLNPVWVEWLMGWPLGWTDLNPLEMGRFQMWLDSHGIPSEGGF